MDTTSEATSGKTADKSANKTSAHNGPCTTTGIHRYKRRTRYIEVTIIAVTLLGAVVALLLPR